MLQVDKSKLGAAVQTLDTEVLSPEELYAAAIGFARRQYPVIVFVTLLMLGLASIYIFTAPPRYTAQAVMIIDTHQPSLFQQQSSLGVEMPIDSTMIDSQVEILKSENIALSVIKDLHLTEDPEFVRSGGGLISNVFGLLSSVINLFGTSGGPASEYALTRRALGQFQGALAIKRVGLTYVIDIDYESLNPDRAAQIANAVADAYVVDALEAKYQSTKRAATWLQDRLKELRTQAADAERVVVDFKAKNNIVNTGGQLLNEQQLAELNSALVQTRAQTAEAKARLDEVKGIVAVGDVDPASPTTGTVADTLHNDVITKFREQYLEDSAKASDWTAKYGAQHLAVVNLHNQMAELRRSIFQELQRTAETYKSDYDIAIAREAAIQKSLDEIVSQSNTTNQAQITLRELDSTAQSYRAMADNFLQQYMMSVQQQSFPITESRLITRATPPGGASHPRKSLVLAAASVGGLILALGIGLMRELADRRFRTGQQVEDILQTDCIAILPAIKGAETATAAIVEERSDRSRLIRRKPNLLWHVVDSPFSRFTESIRAIKIAGDLYGVSKSNKVIAVTSSLPNEGKSTVATALAQLMAQTGSRVVLVDCDLRNPSLTRRLTPDSPAGLLEVLAGRASLADVICAEPTTRLEFLPAVVKSRVAHSSEILASAATKKLFDRLREIYDYIIVDLSPLAPVVDVRTTTNLIDSYLFVIEWGRTKIDVVKHALGAVPAVHDNLLGVVLNKADVGLLSRYENYRGKYYYNRYYARYGYTE
jgi:succinoglycan biosynthesis transport protein ExoP